MESVPKNPQSVIGYDDYMGSSDGEYSPKGTVESMMQPQGVADPELTRKQLRNKQQKQNKQLKKMNIQLRLDLLIQEVLNQPDAEGSTLKHFDGKTKPSMIPTDLSNLEGY